MRYYSTRQEFFIYSSAIEAEEINKINILFELMDKSGVFRLIEGEIVKKEKSVNGRPAFNPYDLLTAIVFSFAFGKGSLRDIEELCRYDLRLIYIMNNRVPSYRTIGNFINDYLVPNEKDVFRSVTGEIYRYMGIGNDILFVDGSKFEADANKYKFVWKPTTFHVKLSDKVRAILGKYGLLRGVPNEGIVESRTIAQKLVELSAIPNDESGKEAKERARDMALMTECLEKGLEYEEKERICGPNRNSYYKTDHDATAMCLKEDYYSGLGSNMHAGYNVQLAVSGGLVSVYLVTQSRNDYADFVPTLERYHEFYGRHPSSVCADSGYGSPDNYSYLESHGIRSFVKHQSWEGNVSGRNPSQFRLFGDSIRCLNGNIGREANPENVHRRRKNSVFFMIEGCDNCGFSAYCKRFMKRKDEPFKLFEVDIEYQKMIENAERNLLSVEGIEMRVNRSIEVEGTFGIIKQDHMYDRFRRISMEKVSTEFMLTALGFNIRKLFGFISSNRKPSYWKAPEGVKSEQFKKPSAKKLSKKASKIKEKSVNEQAKYNGKH